MLHIGAAFSRGNAGHAGCIGVRSMKKRAMGLGLVAVALASALLTSTGDASATLVDFEGYVCRVNVYGTNMSSTPSASIYSEPGCTGTYLGLAYLVRPGGAYPQQADRLYQATLAAVATDRRVTGTWDANIFGKYVDSLQVNSNGPLW
jgi:hypothetical protein